MPLSVLSAVVSCTAGNAGRTFASHVKAKIL